MLNAVIAGKKRGTGLEGARLKLGLADGAEDVITATVFERLSYLPDEIFSAVMADFLGAEFGPIQNISFWPSWFRGDRRVEPDVVITDGQRSLLVESKRYDHARQQYVGQLVDELQAGWLDGELSDDCIFLVLGGLADYSDNASLQLYKDIIDSLPPGKEYRFKLICRSWSQLFRALENTLEHRADAGLHRLLTDIASCYSWHGLRTHRMHWLNGLKPVRISTPPNIFDCWNGL